MRRAAFSLIIPDCVKNESVLRNCYAFPRKQCDRFCISFYDLAFRHVIASDICAGATKYSAVISRDDIKRFVIMLQEEIYENRVH